MDLAIEGMNCERWLIAWKTGVRMLAILLRYGVDGLLRSTRD
jgi:hypothetical protein